MTVDQNLMTAEPDPAGETEQILSENYRETLEKEILRRIRIIECPDYKRVKRFNKADIFFAVGLACLMAGLILFGGSF